MTIGKLGKAYGLLILLAGVLAVYVYFISYLGSGYSPYYGDEYFYFKNTESFILHSSLEAAFTYSGLGSRLLGADAHGPIYPLLYGSISKIIGWNGLTIPLLNFGVLLLTLLSLAFSKSTSWTLKSQQILLAFGCPVTLFYSITFLPELLHISIGIGIYLVLQKFLRTSSKADFIKLLALILISGMIRSTWFFALFGLITIPLKKAGFVKWVFVVLAILLPFLMQYFFHEQVPNAYSQTGEWMKSGQLGKAVDALFFNTKRNLYFLLTYTEGWFYTLQKIWLVFSLVLAGLYSRKDPLLKFGLTGILTLLVFNFVFYKNYDWVDLRMFTPWIIFLNMGLLKSEKNAPKFLLGLNFLSFLFILPLVHQIIYYRTHPTVRDIPESLQNDLKELQSPVLIHLDREILDEFALNQLPIVNDMGDPIRYILPYYELESSSPTLRLQLKDGQLSACPKNSLCQ